MLVGGQRRHGRCCSCANGLQTSTVCDSQQQQPSPRHPPQPLVYAVQLTSAFYFPHRVVSPRSMLTPALLATHSARYVLLCSVLLPFVLLPCSLYLKGKTQAALQIPSEESYLCGGRRGDSEALQPKSCPGNCSGHGVCKRWNQPNQQPQCLCHKVRACVIAIATMILGTCCRFTWIHAEMFLLMHLHVKHA